MQGLCVYQEIQVTTQWDIQWNNTILYKRTCIAYLLYTILYPSSQLPAVLISCNNKSLTWYGYNVMLAHLAKFGYSKHLIIPFWYTLVVYQSRWSCHWYFGLNTSCQNTNHVDWQNSHDMLPKHIRKVRSRYTCKYHYRKCSGQHNSMWHTWREQRECWVHVTPSHIQWLSCILIGCIFYGTVLVHVTVIGQWQDGWKFKHTI